MTKLWDGHEQLHWKLCTKFVQTVTLTFDLATWFLFATHRPVMMITCHGTFDRQKENQLMMSLLLIKAEATETIALGRDLSITI